MLNFQKMQLKIGIDSPVLKIGNHGKLSSQVILTSLSSGLPHSSPTRVKRQCNDARENEDIGSTDTLKILPLESDIVVMEAMPTRGAAKSEKTGERSAQTMKLF
jgi:hypothetical protein